VGQYYMPVLSSAARREDFVDGIFGWFYGHAFDNGLKLMEHSYIGNSLVDAVMRELTEVGGARLVWAGDYADPEPGSDNIYTIVEMVHHTPHRVRPDASKPVLPHVRWVLNHDKHEYVDLHAVPDARWGAIHPVPLLCVEGNGRGGGDFHGENGFIGRWARDRIQVLLPTDSWNSTGWTLIEPNFTED
jgi:hypothetical protein